MKSEWSGCPANRAEDGWCMKVRDEGGEGREWGHSGNSWWTVGVSRTKVCERGLEGQDKRQEHGTEVGRAPGCESRQGPDFNSAPALSQTRPRGPGPEGHCLPPIMSS